MRTSCISHRPKTPIVILSADYLELCDGDFAAAIILKILEYWTDIKLSHGSQTEIENQKRKQAGEAPLEHDLWIYKTGEAFQEDSLGLIKEHDVARGLKVLLDKGLIERRHNPKFKWDRTWQYKINIALINDKLSIPYQCGMQSAHEGNQNGTGAEAIPEITPEDTEEKGSSSKAENPQTPPAPPPPPAEPEKLDPYAVFLGKLTGDHQVLVLSNLGLAQELGEYFDQYGEKTLLDIAAWMAASANGLTSMPQYLRMVGRKAASWKDEPQPAAKPAYASFGRQAYQQPPRKRILTDAYGNQIEVEG